ncbi:hypothetical protein [Streptomyces sp. NPDC004285]
MQLEHRPEGGRLPGLRGEAGQFEAEREPDPRVVHRRHVGGPGALLGHGLRRVGREGVPAGRERCRRGTGQRVGHRVGEGTQQRLGLGQQQRFVEGRDDGVARGLGEGERHRVRGGRHRGGERTEFGQLPGAERPDAPRVVVGGGEAGQQQAARHEVQGQEGGGAPEGGGGRGVAREAGPGEQRQGVPYGKGESGDRHGLAAVALDDRERGVGRGGPVGGRQRFAVRGPEGEPSGARRIGGQEDGGVTEEFASGEGFPGGFAGRFIGSVRERQRIPQI